MPHVILEYSENLSAAMQAAEATKLAHETLIGCGLFKTADIKTRVYVATDFLVGEKGAQGSFLHVTVYILEGRTVTQKQMLSEALRDALSARLPQVDQLSVDIRELAKDSYRKRVAS